MQFALWYRGFKCPAPWIILVLREFLNLYKSFVYSCIAVYEVFNMFSCVVWADVTNIDIVSVRGTIDIYCATDCKCAAAMLVDACGGAPAVWAGALGSCVDTCGGAPPV